MTTKNILIVGAVLLLSVYYFTSKTNTEPVVTNYQQTQPVPTFSKPQSGTFGTAIDGKYMKDSFMSTCMTDSSYKQYCECCYKGIQKHYTVEEMVKFEKMDEEELTQMLVPIFTPCFDYLGNSKAL